MEYQCAKTEVLNHDPPSSGTSHAVGETWCGMMGRSVRNEKGRGEWRTKKGPEDIGEISTNSVTSCGGDRSRGVIVTLTVADCKTIPSTKNEKLIP